MDYIFLSGQFKKDFQESTLQYIVEPITKLIINDKTGMVDTRDDPTNAMPHHPCEEFFIVPRRNDVKNTNNWLNFTNNDDYYMDGNIEKNQTYYYELARKNHENDNVTYETPIHYLAKFTDESITHTIDGNQYSITSDNKLSNNEIQELIDNWKHRNQIDIPSITWIITNFSVKI